MAIWLTGLSGSGKSTLATELCLRLYNSYILDGDVVRTGLCSDLGFSPEDRSENIRRVSEVAAILRKAGSYPIVALISPLRSDREMARKIIGEDRFIEVFVSTPLSTCEERDPKGLYKKARSGEIPNFTGISALYEEPLAPRVSVDTSVLSLQECIDAVMQCIDNSDFV